MRRWHGDVACFIIDVQSKENLKNDIIEWLKLTVSSWCGAIDKNEIIDDEIFLQFELKAVPLTIMVLTAVKQSNATTQENKNHEKETPFPSWTLETLRWYFRTQFGIFLMLRIFLHFSRLAQTALAVGFEIKIAGRDGECYTQFASKQLVQIFTIEKRKERPKNEITKYALSDFTRFRFGRFIIFHQLLIRLHDPNSQCDSSVITSFFTKAKTQTHTHIHIQEWEKNVKWILFTSSRCYPWQNWVPQPTVIRKEQNKSAASLRGMRKESSSSTHLSNEPNF